jgi:hypothetical protein
VGCDLRGMAFVMIFALGCATAGSSSEMYSCWSVCRSGGSRATFIRGIVELGAPVGVATSFDESRKSVSARDQERSELAGRVHIDLIHMGGRAGSFKMLCVLVDDLHSIVQQM